MRKYKVRGTLLEDRLYRELFCADVIAKRRNDSIHGRPDLFVPPNIAIFCDGEYWHKLSHMRRRDTNINDRLMKLGLIVLRFTGNDVKYNIEYCISTVKSNMTVEHYNAQKLITIDEEFTLAERYGDTNDLAHIKSK